MINPLKHIVSIFITMTIVLGLILPCANAESSSLKGFGTHFTHFNDTQKDLPLVYESGVTTLRDGIYWDSVEKQEGVYNWSSYDWWLNDLNQKGIELYIVVTSKNRLYYTDKTKPFFSTQKEIDAFCSFLKALLIRYPFIKYIELANEPNLDFGSLYYDEAGNLKASSTDEERMQCYINMVKAASKTIRETRDDVEIIGCCVANNDALVSPKIKISTFLKTVLPEIYPYIDSVSMHVYVTPRSAESGDMQNRLDRVDEALDNVGGWKKLYTSEVGWVTGNVTNVSVSSEQEQADNIVKIMAIMDEHDYAGTYIYDFRNDGTDTTETEHNFGLINYDRTPKQSYYSLKDYLETTDGYSHVGTFELNGNEHHLYVGDEDAFTLYWDIPESDYVSETPAYQKDLTLDYAKEQFVQILENKYSEVSTKASKVGIDISYDISVLNSYAESGSEITLFNANYELGNKLIDMQLTGDISVSDTDLSSLLYDIHLIGDKMTRIYDVSSSVSESDISELYDKYEALNETTDTCDDETLFLSKAMVDTAKEKLDEVKNNTTVKVNGTKDGVNYTLSGTSVLSIFGEAPVGSYVSFKIEDSGTFKYVDTICADSEGEFNFELPISGDDGTYTVTVGKSSGETVSFDVAKQSTVLSMEYTQAKYILEYATKMMLVTGYDLITAYTTQSVLNDVVSTNFDIQCGPKPQNVSIFSAKYTGDALSECDSEKLTLTPGETAQITLTNTYSPDTTIKYNIFVWDDNLKPYKAVWK